MIFNASYDAENGTGLKMLTPKQMLQRLPIVLKAGNNSETYQMKSDKFIILCINEKNLLESIP